MHVGVTMKHGSCSRSQRPLRATR